MLRVFRHYIPKTLIMLGLAEVIILLASVYVGTSLIPGANTQSLLPNAGPVGPLFFKAGGFAALMLIVMTAMGLYQRDLPANRANLVLRIGLSFGLGLALMSAVVYTAPELFVVRSSLGLALACAFFGILVCRLICHSAPTTTAKRRVVVLGAGERAAEVHHIAKRTDMSGIEIVGYVNIHCSDPRVDASKLISTDGDLGALVRDLKIDEIVVAADDRRKNLPVNELLDCKLNGIQVMDLHAFCERQLGKIGLDSLHPSGMIFSDGFCQAVQRTDSKRVFDLLVSLSILVMAAPIMLITAIAILLESGWGAPVLYRQTRIGRNGKPFDVIKFRSMRTDAEADGVRWAQQNDSRVTRVGNFIRRTRVDELPQLINVLKGDMSFVGPRPERPEFVTDLAEAIPYYELRHRVKPGITGWAQICYPYGSSVADSKEKLQYDLYYIKNYSQFLDLTILFQTAQIVLWGKGAR